MEAEMHYLYEDIRADLVGEAVHDPERDMRDDPYDEMYFRKMKAMYEDMYHTLLINVSVAKEFLEQGQHELALRRITMGIERAEKIFSEKNID